MAQPLRGPSPLCSRPGPGVGEGGGRRHLAAGVGGGGAGGPAAVPRGLAPARLGAPSPRPPPYQVLQGRVEQMGVLLVAGRRQLIYFLSIFSKSINLGKWTSVTRS